MPAQWYGTSTFKGWATPCECCDAINETWRYEAPDASSWRFFCVSCGHERGTELSEAEKVKYQNWPPFQVTTR